jgi:hypothetical protein
VIDALIIAPLAHINVRGQAALILRAGRCQFGYNGA